MTNKLALIVAVALGILSIVGIRLYIQRIQLQETTRGAPVAVWVASVDLPKGTKFVAQDHALEGSIPSSVVQQLGETHIKNPQAYENLALIADVAPNQVLQQYHFSALGVLTDGFKNRLSPGERAVSIPIDAVTGVAGFIKPGDRIDISTALNFRDPLGASDGKIATTRTLIKNVEILATGRILERDDPRAGNSSFETLTLALKPKDVNKLLHVYFYGGDGQLHCSYIDDGDVSGGSGYNLVTDETLFREIKDELTSGG